MFGRGAEPHPILAGRVRNFVGVEGFRARGLKDHINIRPSHPGSKAPHNGDTKNP